MSNYYLFYFGGNNVIDKKNSYFSWNSPIEKRIFYANRLEMNDTEMQIGFIN